MTGKRAKELAEEYHFAAHGGAPYDPNTDEVAFGFDELADIKEKAESCHRKCLEICGQGECGKPCSKCVQCAWPVIDEIVNGWEKKHLEEEKGLTK